MFALLLFSVANRSQLAAYLWITCGRVSVAVKRLGREGANPTRPTYVHRLQLCLSILPRGPRPATLKV